MVSLDRCNGKSNTFYYLSSRICVLNKTDDVNLNVFSMITRINESKTLKPVYDKKCLKTKIKSYEGKINTNFHDDGISKESSHCICQ